MSLTRRARPTFVYDGDCAFCSSCARFIERHIRTPATVLAWQRTDLSALGLAEAQCEAAVQWVPASDDRGTAAGPAAIGLLLLSSASGYWRVLGRLVLLRPVLALAWPVYRFVARNRDRLPGGTATCALPQAQRDQLRGQTGPPPG
jgi:predicted DCC family thiol-disulfide oxidoreductase YuxK